MRADVGTVVSVNGQPQGAPLPGEDFYRALLRCWLGDRPASGSLRRALLGQSSQTATPQLCAQRSGPLIVQSVP